MTSLNGTVGIKYKEKGPSWAYQRGNKPFEKAGREVEKGLAFQGGIAG